VEPFYFEFFVAPLGLLVVVLVASVYYCARREEIARKKTNKLVQSYVKEKARQQELTNKELANLEKLLENKSIDKATFERLKKVLMMNKTKQGEEATDLLNYAISQKSRHARKAAA